MRNEIPGLGTVNPLPSGTARYRIVNRFIELRGDDDILLARFQLAGASDADPSPRRH